MHPDGFLRTLQFGSNSGAGGVFLGTPDEDRAKQEENGNMMQGDDEGDDERSTTHLVRDIVLIFLIGVGLILALVCSTYGFAMVSDRWCCCCPWFRPVSDMEEFRNRFDRGIVARKARLWGLTLEERARILQRFFQERIFLYNNQHQVSKNNDVAPQRRKQLEEDSPLKTEQPTEGNDRNDDDTDKIAGEAESTEEGPSEEENKAKEASEDTTNGTAMESSTMTSNDNESAMEGEDKQDGDDQEGKEGFHEVLDDADHERICCICLNEYESGDKLITGTQCIHKTHYDCCMEWMKKHDHCPYCRKEMLTALEMRLAAIEVLGHERVGDLGGACAPAQPTVAAVPDTPGNTTESNMEIQESETPSENDGDEHQRDGDIETGNITNETTVRDDGGAQPNEIPAVNDEMQSSPPMESSSQGEPAVGAQGDS